MRALGKCEINRMKKEKKRSRTSHRSTSSLPFSLSLSLSLSPLRRSALLLTSAGQQDSGRERGDQSASRHHDQTDIKNRGEKQNKSEK